MFNLWFCAELGREEEDGGCEDRSSRLYEQARGLVIPTPLALLGEANPKPSLDVQVEYPRVVT